MQPKLFLRIAAALMLLHTIGHSIGALSWTQPPNPRIAAVITSMSTEHFDFMGRSSTLANFYNGYGMILIFVLLLISIQLWLLSSRPAKPMQFALGIFLLAQAILEYIYFFPFAAVISLLAAILTLLSLRAAGKPN